MVKHSPSPSKYTLFPSRRRKGITLESKSKFNERISSEGCSLDVSECKRKHLAGCLTAMRKHREWLKGEWSIKDPRFDEPRPCTIEEVYWYLVNDPRSEFSLNWGRQDRPTAEEFFAPYAAELSTEGESKPIVLAESASVAVETSLPASGKEPDVEAAESVDWSKKKAWKITEVIRWVFDNMKNPNIDLDTAPCPGALALLRWAEHKGGETQFFTYFLTKLVPSQKEMEANERRSDNGSNLFPLLDELLKEAL